MNRAPTLALAVGVCAVIATACSAKVLSFEGTSSTAFPPDLPPGLAVQGLTGTQPDELCTWLNASYPVAGAPLPADASLVSYLPGCVNGAAYGCTVMWMVVTQADCVLNLKHSACMASLSDLQTCVQAFRNDFAQSSQGGPSACTAPSACAPFHSSPGCDETVFIDLPSQSSPGPGSAQMELPIAPGASCKAAPDAGSD